MTLLLNAYCTHRSPPPLEFAHRLRARRDRSDPELEEHLRGCMEFVMGGGSRPMNQSRFHVPDHLERVRHQFSLEVEAEHMHAFKAWAGAANAIVFMTDLTVRAPNGAVLVDPESGDAEPEANVPSFRDALERKARTERHLMELGIPIAKTLPPVVSEAEVELRSVRDIEQRCLALFICARRADSIAANRPIQTRDLKAKSPLAFDALTPLEREFMNDPSPLQQDVFLYTWRYEAAALLAWSIGATPDLPFPKTMCDVPALAKRMFAIMKTPLAPKPVSTSAVLDALDLHYRLHWATTEAQIHAKPPPKGVDPGVVEERHYALNWLTRFLESDWDDVETPT